MKNSQELDAWNGFFLLHVVYWHEIKSYIFRVFVWALFGFSVSMFNYLCLGLDEVNNFENFDYFTLKMQMFDQNLKPGKFGHLIIFKSVFFCIYLFKEPQQINIFNTFFTKIQDFFSQFLIIWFCL